MLWLLAGALYKLFEGSPNDLPEIVKDMSPMSSSWATMRTAIIVELAVVGLVIAKPRIGWLFLAGVFATFLAVLFPLVQAGESSWGCFGSNVTIEPLHMMGIDGALLLLILISKPWRLPKEAGLGFAAFLPFLVVAVAAPTMKLTEPKLPVTTPAKINVGTTQGGDTVWVVEDPGADQPEGGAEGQPPVGADPKPTGPVETPPQDPEPTEEAGLPEFYDLPHFDWEGKMFDETDLAAFVDQSMGAVLPNSHVVVYRQTCEVCAKHLEGLWLESQENPDKWAGEKQLVLIRVIEHKDETEDNKCMNLPQPHQMVTMPALKRGYGIKTPMTFEVDEAYTIQNVQDLSAH